MTLAARWRLAVALGVCLAALGALAPSVRAGLAISQRSNGLPGKPRESVTEQELLVGAGKLRLRDKSGPRARSVVIRLDRGVIFELDPATETYIETPFSRYREQREEAERDREKAREAVIAKFEKGLVSRAELDQWLAKKGLREDGKRVVTVSRGPWEVVDGTREQRIAVELNSVTQVAVWQTDKFREYEPPKELFEFYDRCGVFPEDVAAKLKEAVTLFPLRIYANIDLFSAGAEIETRVEGVVDWKEDPAKFEVPSTYRLVKEFPEPAAARKEYRCPVCGKVVDPVATPFSERDPKTGEKLFFDQESHWIEYLQNPEKFREKPK